MSEDDHRERGRMEKLVSIVMPVYNAEKFLAKAIESVLGQTYRNFELFVIDDCSKDSSLHIAQTYEAQDNRIRVLKNEKNLNVAKTRNYGIQEATGEFIALLDSDDIWDPQKLERQMELLERENAGLAYCSYDFIDESGASILKPFLVPKETNFNKMLYGNDIGCSTVLIRADIFKKHLFHPDCYHEDYALWMEMLKDNVKAVGLTEVYVHYRKVTGSRSDNKINAAKERWNIFRKELKLPLWISVVAFCGYAMNGVIKHYLRR